MKFHLTLRKVRVSALLRKHVQERLQAALAHAEKQIAAVSVRLLDGNGRRGGGDKRCEIEWQWVAGGRVLVRETRADLFHAVNHAADRARKAVTRALRQGTHIND